MRILNVLINLKHKAILYLTYSSGLRVGEVVRLRLHDIDRSRKLIYVRQGKGKKDRYTLLSETALDLLISYVRNERPSTLLFPGAEPGRHIRERSV